MSKKHFNALAEAVRDWRRVCLSVDEADAAQLVARLAAACQASNVRFNRDRFFTACLGPVRPTAGRKAVA